MSKLVKASGVEQTRGAGADVYALARLLSSHGVDVRFAHDSSLQLSCSDVADITWRCDDLSNTVQAQIVSTHLGLTGATSPLPHEALAALEGAMASDEGGALTQWLEHLHHRLLELLHAGVNRAQPSTCASAALTDTMSRQLLMGSAHAANMLPPSLRLAAHAVLSQPWCGANDIAWAVATVLKHYHLASEVRCVPMAGGMLPLGDDSRWELGRSCSTLGVGCVVGHSAASPTSHILVQIGPVPSAWVSACAASYAEVTAYVHGMVRATLPPECEANVELLLGTDALEPLQLQATPHCHGRPKPFTGLGANVFLGAPPAAQAVPWPAPLAPKHEGSHSCAGTLGSVPSLIQSS